MKVLLSIKPEFVRKIFSDQKNMNLERFYLEKKLKVLLSILQCQWGRIVGEFTISNIISGKPNIIWEQTKEHSGITEKFYTDYFMNRKLAHAIEIGRLIKYEIEINPFIKIPNFVAPQSFKYIQCPI